MSRKWIAVGLVVGLLAVAVTGGAVLASGGNPDEGGGEEAQEVVVKDGDVAVQSIENTEVESGEPDALAVRIAEILGTDPDATSDAMAQVDAAVETGPDRSEADVHEREPGVDAMSVEAEGLSYFEYGTRLGAILGVDGERAARAIAQAYEELYAVERDIWDNGSGRDKRDKYESDKHPANPGTDG